MSEVKTYLLLCASALIAGVINSVAGGGTLLTFPALFSVLGSSVMANATSTVAVVPGSMAGAWGYRREVQASLRWSLLLLVPSLVGGIIGSLLVARMEEKYFDALVPWLILAAAILFLAQPTISRLAGVGKSHTPATSTALTLIIIFQLIVSIYGGYFGAGMGILMLSALGLMGISDIHQMNAVKTFLASCTNGVAAAVFMIEDKVHWRYALVMAVASIAGGYLGAHTARRLNRDLVRWMVITIGFGLAVHYFYKQ